MRLRIGHTALRMMAAAVVTAVVTVSSVVAVAQEWRFDHGPYAKVLSEYVNEAGVVDYEGLKKNRGGLDDYVKSLGEVTQGEYGAWDDDEKMAYLINAYNAVTLTAIIDHYPIKAGFFASLSYPKNSIRQISGVWDKLEWKVAGENVTLEHIEHEMLRKDFAEPRIHMAINCASVGCPPLRREPYVADRLEEQLADQSRRFLSDVAKFRIDRREGRVYLSPIFDWFGEDFVKGYKPSSGFVGNSEEKCVLSFAAEYVSEADAEYLRRGGYRVRYLDYDWSLNEQ